MLDLNKWMGMVPNAAEHGYLIDHMLQFCHWFMAVLFVGWTAFFLFVIWRFHKSRNPKANYYGVQSKASAHIEFMVVLIEAVLLLGFALPLWGKRVNPEEWPDKDKAVRVHIIAEQFAWNFHYPGPDNVFGKQRADLVTPNNLIGLDPNDPAGKDDIVTKNEFYLVNKKPCVLEITSKDVIHSVSLQHMRMCQDALPGSRIPMWFRPIKEGSYELVCAQLCGAGHYAMKGTLVVADQKKFDEWFAEQNQLQHPNSQPAAPAAVPAPAK